MKTEAKYCHDITENKIIVMIEVDCEKNDPTEMLTETQKQLTKVCDFFDKMKVVVEKKKPKLVRA